jgi:hypothetical protein
MAQAELTTSAQSQQSPLAPVRVYEYVVPGAVVGPPRVARAPRPMPLDIWILYRWIKDRYGLQ